MYQVADIDSEICSKTRCRLCTQFWPEPNMILYDTEQNVHL
jgi:Pyruvate/2-oxoacid:ferredoxin oxidoreductase delta subunit